MDTPSDGIKVVPELMLEMPAIPYHAPVGTKGLAQLFGVGGQRGDIEASLQVFAFCGLAPRDDHDDGAQALPVGMVFFEPGDVLGNEHRAAFDASMVAVEARCLRNGDVLEPACPLLREEQVLIAAQAALIALETEDVVGTLVDNLFGDVLLASHGIPWRRWRRLRP